MEEDGDIYCLKQLIECDCFIGQDENITLYGMKPLPCTRGVLH